MSSLSYLASMLLKTRQCSGHIYREGYSESLAEFGKGTIFRIYCPSALGKCLPKPYFGLADNQR